MRRLACRHCNHIHWFKEGELPHNCENCGKEHFPKPAARKGSNNKKTIREMMAERNNHG